MKKLLVLVVAALVAAGAFAERTISAVSVQDGIATVSFAGEGPEYSTLVLAYGVGLGGVAIEDWEHNVCVGQIAEGQDTLAVALPSGWGTTYTNAKFYLYNGIVDRPDSYVMDGLAAFWDVLTRKIDPSDAAAPRKWRDSVGGFEFVSLYTAVVENRTIRFTSDAVLDAESSSLLLDNGIVTVESMLTVYNPNVEMILGTAKSGLDWFNFNLTKTVGQSMYFTKAAKSPSSSWVSGIKIVDTESTYSAVYDQTGSSGTLTAAYRNGLDEWNTEPSYWNGGTDRMILKSGWFRTLRIYNRELAADELKANAAVDRARYIDLSTTDEISSSWRFSSAGASRATVVTAVSGEHGSISGGGRFLVGDTVELSATPDADCSFQCWLGLPAGVDATRSSISFPAPVEELAIRAVFRTNAAPFGPVGRTLDITSVIKDSDGNPVAVTVGFGDAVVDGTERFDTLYMAYGSADAGEEIREWPAVRPIRAMMTNEVSCQVSLPEGWGQSVRALRFFFIDHVDADSYVKDGLVAQWDGTDNVATGTHDPAATVWRDRIAGREFALYGVTDWSENAIGFEGTSTSYGLLSAENTAQTFGKTGQPRTIETCFDTRQAAPGSGWGSCVLDGPYNMLVAAWESTGYFSSLNQPIYAVDLSSPEHQVSLAYGIDGNQPQVFVDGRTPAVTGTDKWDNLADVGGQTWIGIGGKSKRYPTKGKIYSLRVYHATLTGAQREVNLAVDRKIVQGEVSTGTTVSCSPALFSDSSVKGKFSVVAEVRFGTVTGTGAYDEGSEVTLSVTMQEGCGFVRWLGNLPAGVDPTSQSITFVPTEDIVLTAEVWTPWVVVFDDQGIVTEIYNPNLGWRLGVTADADRGLTVTKVIAGELETLDLSEVEAHTGYKVVAIGNSVFRERETPRYIRHAGSDIRSIGASAFYRSFIERFDPVTLPGLESIGESAFEESKIKVLWAPNLKTAAERAFYQSTLTNCVKGEVFDIPMERFAFGGLPGMTGSLTIDSPSTTIAYTFLWQTGLTNITVNSPVTKIDSWGLGEYWRGDVDIYWNVAAPTEFGPYSCIGTELIANRYMRLHIRSDAQGWRKCPYFVPIADIPDKYKTPAYGWMPSAIGWIETAREGYVDTCRCWLIYHQGLMLIIR